MFKSGQSLADALKAMRLSFTNAGIDTAALDARVLVGAACRLSDGEMISQGERRVGQMEVFRLERYTARRLAGEPVSRILGRREFWGMDFTVTPDTLDPRPDTETLVEAALDWGRDYSPPHTPPQAGWEAKPGRSLRILDLGTGTGCILISLLKEFPDATGIAVDISEGALAVAAENAKRHGVADRIEFRTGSWFTPIKNGEMFDLIVSNPPYIAESEMESLGVEVKNHDPRAALTDEKDGLDAYRAIYPQLAKYSNPHGMAFFEMGYAQGVPMARLVEDAGATLERIIKDLAGHERVVALSLRNQTGIIRKS
jgi:release factor glutamine methyltransferase